MDIKLVANFQTSQNSIENIGILSAGITHLIKEGKALNDLCRQPPNNTTVKLTVVVIECNNFLIALS